jgi:hypothetical protein
MFFLSEDVGKVGKGDGRLVHDKVGSVLSGRCFTSLLHLFEKLLHLVAVFVKELFCLRGSFGIGLGRALL